MFDNVFTVASFIISLVALIFSIFGFWQSRVSAVRDFFSQGDTVEMKTYRKVIYDIYNHNTDLVDILENLKIQSVEVSHVISFYDFWALMVKKHYLPEWTFQASSKYTAVNIYNKVKPYVEFRRIEQPDYANHFEWLVNRLK